MEMILEYGKRYQSRHGMTTTPLVPTPFECSQRFAGYFTNGDDVTCLRTWDDEGSSVSGLLSVDRDLVGEIK
jgi:hypothetical protein